ncbi:ROK family protein [Candidatus Woesearchaeota archaeon]|nr:ROK family protein [Candidatus Woesearchaeota archaeon]
MKVGFDCGGTKTEACVFKGSDLVDHFFVAKPSTKTTVFSMIRQITRKHKIDFIGIGFPAPVNNGKVTIVNNIPEWNNTNIAKTITDKFGIMCKVENDANCFALAEAKNPDNKEYNTVVGVTLGTGLGVGIVRRKRIITGSTGAAGELCKIPYEGKTLEAFIGKKFFKNREAIDVFRNAALGKKSDIKKVEEYSMHLGKMLSIIVLTLEPRLIVFGGSISRSFSLFEKEMRIELEKYIYPQSLKKLTIKESKLTHAACRGAASL